jgi:hypothetical protein
VIDGGKKMDEIAQQIEKLIERGINTSDEEEFNRLALKVFEHQHSNNCLTKNFVTKTKKHQQM